MRRINNFILLGVALQSLIFGSSAFSMDMNKDRPVKDEIELASMCSSPSLKPGETMVASTYLAITGKAISCKDFSKMTSYVQGEYKNETSNERLGYKVARYVLDLPESAPFEYYTPRQFAQNLVLNLTGESISNEEADYYVKKTNWAADPNDKKKQLAKIAAAVVWDYVKGKKNPNSNIMNAKVNLSICFAKNAFYLSENEETSKITPQDISIIKNIQNAIVDLRTGSKQEVFSIVKKNLTSYQASWPCDAKIDDGSYQCKNIKKKYYVKKCLRTLSYNCSSSTGNCPPSVSNIRKVSGFGRIWMKSIGNGIYRINVGTIDGNGRFIDDYWSGNKNTMYTATYQLDIQDISSISKFLLKKANYDDSMAIWINGKFLWGSRGGDDLKLCSQRRTATNHSDGSGCSSSFFEGGGNLTLSSEVDAKPFLKNGTNTIKIAIVVGRNGEAAAYFDITGKCPDSCAVKYEYGDDALCTANGKLVCNATGAPGGSYAGILSDMGKGAPWITTNLGDGNYLFAFGKLSGKNYWGDGVYDRDYYFNISDLNKVYSFVFDRARWDDWLGVWVNGKIVWTGPYGGLSATKLEKVGGQACYGPSQCRSVELSTIWTRSGLGINLLPFLKNGENHIRVRTLVAGSGQGGIGIIGRFKKSECSYE